MFPNSICNEYLEEIKQGETTMTKKLKVYCPYSALDLGWETIKTLHNVTFKKPCYLKIKCNERF